MFCGRQVAMPSQRKASTASGIEVVERERVRALDVGLERLEHVAGRELAVEAVVHQEEVGRRAARERGREPGDEVVAVARLDELHVDLGLFLGERPDHRPVRVDLGRVAEDEQPDRAGGALVARRRRLATRASVATSAVPRSDRRRGTAAH